MDSKDSKDDKKNKIKGAEDYKSLIDDIINNTKAHRDDDGFDIDDVFDEYILSSVDYGLKNGKRTPYFPCDTCQRKKIITEQYNKVCNKEYIPPYIDKDCRDFKIALVIDRIDEDILLKAFKYLIIRTSIKEIIACISDPEWKVQTERILRTTGYNKFIEKNFGNLSRDLISEMLFDVNFCYFNHEHKRNLNEIECVDMVKYYIVLSLRERIKESIFKIAKLIELELEYKIAVIEGEIRYYIKCILQEIVITPLPATNYNITHFNKIASLTEILSIEDGIGGGKHDERSDFRHIRDTVRKYEKVVRTTFEALNDKIEEYNKLINERRFIVGVTGICETPNVVPYEDFKNRVVVPPSPCIVLNPPVNDE